MSRIIRSLLLQALFWLVFFNLSRLVFLLYYSGILRAEKIGLWEAAGVFVHSVRLDLATTCYILVLPFFLLALQSFFKAPWINRVNRVYSAFVIIGYSLTAAGEMGIYAEWKTKLSYKVLKYLAHPSEIYYSAGTGPFFILLFLFIALSVSGFLLYNRYFFIPVTEKARRFLYAAGFTLLLPGILVSGMRGGWQQIPINQSESYYSDHNILNLAAVNNGFNLYISVFENLKNFNHNPYHFMEQAEADRILAGLYATPKDTTVSVLTTNRPNIILLIMESWSADLIQSLGGKEGITPEFSKLESGGILFEQIYASGARSEQGMASLFSGFPSHPISSITVQPDKFVKLPSLVKVLKTHGYHTAFYFGGQLIYGNIKSYIFFNGFHTIMEGADFPDEIPRGKLGIHDQYTLNYLSSDASGMKQPFFASLFTVSTHSPWDQPFEKPLKWGENEREYINAAYYTDHCLGEFFRMAKKQPWYPNTLFIIVADHSHNSYRNWHPYTREYHRIPMLFTGEVIKPEFRGTTYGKTGNQHDLAATLLKQLGLPAEGFRYSKNLFNPLTKDFAYYSTEDGAGWFTPAGYFTWDAGPDYYYDWSDKNLPDSVRLQGKAYLQTVFRDYLNN